jgi:citrate synthase
MPKTEKQREEETPMATTETTEQAQDGSVATEGQTLSVTDNRTGKSYELEITDGTVRAMDLRQIKVSDDDFGLMSYDPAFTNTASCRSAITFIDGEKGILQHRGIPIEQLCEHSSYLEVAYLLTFGELPTEPQLERWVFDVTHHTFVHEDIKNLFETFRYDAHPMGMLLSGVGALSTFYPDAKRIDDPEERYMAAIRLIAKVPTLAAFAYRHNMGLPYVYPDNDLNYAGNFLSMLYKKTEVKYEPDERLAKALDVLFILHADHEQNCSTNAVRSVGSSQVDPYSAVAAGVAALYGPLHGGANEAVLRMLRRIESVDNIPDFLKRVKDREERLMGFGHRVYKNYDPRARIIQKHMEAVFEATEYNPLVEIAQELEKRALDDDYFTDRKLYPNVDFYSGIIYEALEIPTEMFTVIFAIPRTSGWVAQWMEMNDDSEQKIARPRQIYTGDRDRDYVPIADREGPEKITGPPARRPKRQRRGA